MASFVGPKKVVVEDVEYTADHINIAVGGRPMMPEVPGAEFCIDRCLFAAIAVGCSNRCWLLLWFVWLVLLLFVIVVFGCCCCCCLLSWLL